MKLIEQIIDSNGKTRLLFATNKKELELLYAVVRESVLHFPKVPETTIVRNRLSNIKNGLEKGLRELEEKSDYYGGK